MNEDAQNRIADEGPGEFVLVGTPSSGRTHAILSAIKEKPVISTGDRNCDANILVVHYSAICNIVSRAKAEGIGSVLCIKSQGDFADFADFTSVGGEILVVCLDIHFNRLCDNLRDVSVQRVVFDNLESLRVKNYSVLSCRSKWFVCTPSLLEAPRPRCRTHREARMAFLAGKSVHMPPRMECYTEKMLFREVSTIPLLSAIKVLYDQGKRHLASACLPCENVRLADAPSVLGPEPSERLKDACPICYEDRGPRIVVPCCKQNFCAKCLVRHLQGSQTCPMCRSQIDIYSCISVSEIAIPRISGIIGETRKLVRKCMAHGNPKILIVAGRGVYDSVWEIMWHADIDFVDIRGNNQAIHSKIQQFSSDSSRVGVVRNHHLRMAPIRTPSLTHVIFLGHLKREEQAHWASRGIGPHSVRPPKVYSLESVYDSVFHVFG